MFHKLLIGWTLAPWITGKFRHSFAVELLGCFLKSSWEVSGYSGWDAVFSALPADEWVFIWFLLMFMLFFSLKPCRETHPSHGFPALRQVPDSTLRRLKRENGGQFAANPSFSVSYWLPSPVLWTQWFWKKLVKDNEPPCSKCVWVFSDFTAEVTKEAIMFLEAAAFWRQPQCIKYRRFKSRLQCVLLL